MALLMRKCASPPRSHNRCTIGMLTLSGRLDLNLRPLAPQRCGAAPDHTARIETQAPEIPAPPDQLPDAPGALCAGSSIENGAPVGRGFQHTSVPPPSLEDLYKRVRDAVARGDFDPARELIDEAARSASH